MKLMAMVSCCLFAAVAGAGELDGWRKKVDLSLSCDLAETEIKDGLPALVRISEAGISGFLYADFMRNDGQDLVFVVDGQRIPHEVDTWNPSGESLVWVRLPSTAQGTTLTMYYGRAEASTDMSAAVWEGYVGVWHLGENSDGAKDTEIHDSSANGYGGTAYTGSGSGQTVAGKFGNGWQISSKTGDLGGGILLTSLAEVSLGTSFTVSGWMYHAKDAYAWDRIVCRRDADSGGGGFYSRFPGNTWGNGNITVYGGSGTGTKALTNAVNGGWAHIALSYDNNAARLISNGVPTSPITVGAPTDNGKPVSFGIESDRGQATWNGVMDELRIRKGEYDANYLAAEYAAMNVGEADIFAFGKPTSVTTEKVTVNFINNASKQKFVAMSDGERVTSGGSVWSNALVVVTVTPGKSYAYPTAPDGWTKQGATIVRIVAAATDPTTVVIPDAEINPDFVGWKKKVTVSLAAALADTEITEGLPTLVRLSEETVEGFRYDDFKRDDGADLVFIAGGLRLPHEVDTWNPGGESLVWVRLPSTAQGTSFTMCYGRAEASTDMSAAVWEGYAGVWHLNENSNGTHDTTVHDSTANGYDGTAYTGNANAKGQTVQGKLGSGWQISSSKDKQGGGIVIHSMTNATLGTAFTVSGWYWHKANDAYYDHLIYRKNAVTDGNGFASEISGGSWSGSIKVCGAGSAFKTFSLTNAVNGGWAHIAVALEGTAARVVNNGVASASQSGIATPTDNGYAIAFGNDSDHNDCVWCGSADELRIRTGAFDANFAAAEYKAMNVGADDIFAFGKPEEYTPGLALIIR